MLKVLDMIFRLEVESAEVWTLTLSPFISQAAHFGDLREQLAVLS